MKIQEKPSELSDEKLINQEKSLKFLTGVLIGALATLFVISVYMAINEKKYYFLPIPIALSSIVFINLGILKKLKAEKINPCATCGTDGHEFHAKYCFHCGTEL